MNPGEGYTILNLQNNTFLQCEILTLLTILYSTYNTKLAILTHSEILILLTMRYTTNSAILHSYLHYLQYGLHTLQKPENKGGGDVW